MSGFLVLLVLEYLIFKEILSQAPSSYRSYQWTPPAPPIYEAQKPTYTYRAEQNPPLTYSYTKPPIFTTPTGVASFESVKSYPESNQYPTYSKHYTPSASPITAEIPPTSNSYAPLPYPKLPSTQTITFSTDVQSKQAYTYPKPSNLIPLPQDPSPMTAPTTTTTPKPAAVSQKTSEGLDSTVLNNLAIALQLLIVSNLLKSPIDTTESFSLPPVEEAVSSFAEKFTPTADYSNPYYSKPFEGFVSGKALPNANFLGSSNVMSPSSSIMSSYTPSSTSRSSYTLMSPYEALSPEPVPSFRSVGSFPSDFQSPYAFSD